MLGRGLALIAAWCLVLGAATQTPAPPQTATFVSLGTDRGGPTITYDSAGQRATALLAPDVRVYERAIGQQWQDAALSALRPGEPLTLVAGAAGIVAVYAEYAQVAERLVAVAGPVIVGTSGNAYTLVGGAVDAAAGLPLGMYLLLRTDPRTQDVFDLVASRTPLKVEGAAAPAKVVVTFVVRVPLNTPPSDAVYLATNAQSWVPNGIRMTPLTGNRWTATLELSGGALLEYKYTRGAWTNDERNAAGSEIANRSLSVAGLSDQQVVTDVVARWADLPS